VGGQVIAAAPLLISNAHLGATEGDAMPMTMSHPKVETSARESVSLIAHDAPIWPKSATLVAKDAFALARFYEEMLGFKRISEHADSIVLGAGQTGFLVLRHDPVVSLATPREAGLFHIAYLLPDRASLARWFVAAQRAGAPFEGASDHDVSEAFYLRDPEGNGIEVYVDRPRDLWRRSGSGYEMTTDAMDIADLVALADRSAVEVPYLPNGTGIGHLHVQSADVEAVASFYRQELGTAETHRRPAARFLSWGGYHHHIAVNGWQAREARRRDGVTGLTEIRFALAAAPIEAGPLAHAFSAGEKEATLVDPIGIRLVFERA
jgi:catechol 2,3-dioxygenase